MDNISGGLGRQLVFKQYKGKTVVTAYPDMSNVKPSAKQTKTRNVFAEAVVYAQGITHDPVKKAEYAKRVKQGQTVYHFAVKEYLDREKK